METRRISAGLAPGHEEVIAFEDRSCGLRGFVALHSTRRGPACGGVRLYPYQSDEDALADALRLSQGMTYKSALAELPAGGGKAVIFRRRELVRNVAFVRFGELVESLHGRYLTGPDVGIEPEDLAAVARSTSHVADETDPKLGDISLHTALGVWHAVEAALQLTGIATAQILIQGLGHVGMRLARLAHRAGHPLIVADTDAERVRTAVEELGARAVPPETALEVECDVFAPCALGGILMAGTAASLKCRIVCGAANNQLATPAAAEILRDRGILYAPDYLVNAGGVIRGVEYFLLGREDSLKSLPAIGTRLRTVVELARKSGESTAAVADRMAEERFRG